MTLKLADEVKGPDEPTYTPGTPVKRYGHINWAHDHGSYSGCKAKIFNPEDGVIDEQINAYFETAEHAALVVDIRSLMNGSVMVFYTRRYTDEELSRLNRISALAAEMEEKEKLEKLEAEERVRAAAQEEIDRATREREVLQKKAKLLMSAGLTHLRNCKKKTEAEVNEARATMEALAELDKPVVKDELPAKTELT